jgi:hypothetical protein
MDVSGRLEPDPEWTRAPLPRPGLRFRLLATCHRCVRFGPWLVPFGALLMVWGLSLSLVGGAIGAVLVGLGIAASLWQPRLRRRQAWSRHRRTPSRSVDPGGRR